MGGAFDLHQLPGFEALRRAHDGITPNPRMSAHDLGFSHCLDPNADRSLLRCRGRRHGGGVYHTKSTSTATSSGCYSVMKEMSSIS